MGYSLIGPRPLVCFLVVTLSFHPLSVPSPSLKRLYLRTLCTSLLRLLFALFPGCASSVGSCCDAGGHESCDGPDIALSLPLGARAWLCVHSLRSPTSTLLFFFGRGSRQGCARFSAWAQLTGRGRREREGLQTGPVPRGSGAAGSMQSKNAAAPYQHKFVPSSTLPSSTRRAKPAKVHFYARRWLLTVAPF